MHNSSVGSVRGSEGSEVLGSSGLTFGSEMVVLSLVLNLMGSPFVVHLFGFKRFLEGLGVSGSGVLIIRRGVLIRSGHGRVSRGDRSIDDISRGGYSRGGSRH